MVKRMFVLMFIVALICSLSACGSPERISGNEWLKVQEASYNDLQSFSEGVDQVVTLYIMESITAEDFEKEVMILKQQYSILLKFRKKLTDDYPVEPQSHSYVSKRGTEAIENMYDCFEELLNNLLDENGKALRVQETSYRYLAYKQNMQTYVVEYMTAIQWLNEAESATDIEK